MKFYINKKHLKLLHKVLKYYEDKLAKELPYKTTKERWIADNQDLISDLQKIYKKSFFKKEITSQEAFQILTCDESWELEYICNNSLNDAQEKVSKIKEVISIIKITNTIEICTSDVFYNLLKRFLI